MAAIVQMLEEKPQSFRSKKILSSDDQKYHITLDGNVRLLDVLNFDGETMSCSFSEDGNLLAIGLSNGTIKIFSVESKAIVYHIERDESKQPVTSLKWRPATKDNQQLGNVLLVTYSSGFIKRFHITSTKLLSQYHVDAQVMTSAYNSDGSQSISGCSDGKILMMDEKTNTLLTGFEPSTNSDRMDGHMMRVFSVQYHPHDDNLFISGGWDDTIQFCETFRTENKNSFIEKKLCSADIDFDPKTKKGLEIVKNKLFLKKFLWWDSRVNKKHSIKKIVGPHICGEGLHIDPTSLNMVAASWRKSRNLQVFDFNSGKLIKEIEQDFNKSMLYCALWENKDTIVCGGSHHNILRIISYITSQSTGSIDNLPGAVYSIDHTHYGSRKLIACCSAKSLYLIEDTN